MLITAALIAWAGTIDGAYAWGARTETPDIWHATMCSMGQKEFQDAGRALDKIITIEGFSLPLRAWGREESGSTLYIKSLVEEAAFQEQRHQRALEIVASDCFTED